MQRAAFAACSGSNPIYLPRGFNNRGSAGRRLFENRNLFNGMGLTFLTGFCPILIILQSGNRKKSELAPDSVERMYAFPWRCSCILLAGSGVCGVSFPATRSWAIRSHHVFCCSARGPFRHAGALHLQRQQGFHVVRHRDRAIAGSISSAPKSGTTWRAPTRSAVLISEIILRRP